MDNYYTSAELSEKLLTYRAHNVRTLRNNRKKNPKPVIRKKLKNFWMRKRKVYFLK